MHTHICKATMWMHMAYVMMYIQPHIYMYGTTVIKKYVLYIYIYTHTHHTYMYNMVLL